MSAPRLITINGLTRSLTAWSHAYKIEQSTVSKRIRDGWDPVEAITTPARRHHWLPAKVIGNVSYVMWQSVVQRCCNPRYSEYHRYGGRGISVCAAWRESFERFATDLVAEIGPRPDGHQIDRVDNDRGYEPGNVRWATPKENGNNRSNSIRITYDGETLTASQWAERVGGPTGPQIARRIAIGWSAEEAITKPPEAPAEELEIDGERMPIANWSKRTGRNKSTIRARLRAGMSPKDAVFGELSRRFDGLCSRCEERPRVDSSLCAPCRRAYKSEWRAKRKAEGHRVT
jgi:hypothetical protein